MTPFIFLSLTIVSAILLADGQTSIPNDTIELGPASNLDVTASVQTVTEFDKTIGGIIIPLTKQVQLVSNTPDNPITLVNTAEPNIIVQIPDQTKISAPDTWDQTIIPPVTITTSGTVPTGFDVPTTSIQVGSSAVTLVFDEPVVITLNGVTGQTAYKLAGTNTWILISTCAGTFTNPTDPGEPNECAISDGTNTKILTYHFTEFAGLTETPTAPATAPATTPSTKSSSSGGHGRTGVGPSSGGAKYFAPSIQTIQNLPNAPAWFLDVVLWEQQGKITLKEMFAAYQWILENKK